MIADTRNPRDSYYSSLFDDYVSGSSRAESPANSPPAWASPHKRRSSLNVGQPRNSIGLRRQPSCDFPSPSVSTFSNTGSSRIVSPLTGGLNLRDVPPSPGYIFSHYYHSSEDRSRESFGASSIPTRNKQGHADSQDTNQGLSIPSWEPGKRDMPPQRTPSPSGSSLGEEHFTRSSVSSYEDDGDSSFHEKRVSAKTSSLSLRKSHGSIKSRDPDRDQYGFRRSYQWVTRKEYADFESTYSRIQARRKMKWDVLLMEHNNNLPSKSSKLKRYIRKGVPPSLRGRVWFHYSGAENKMKNQPDLYEMLLQKSRDSRIENEYVEVIERDLHRTFPENIKFKSTIVSEDGASPTLSTDNIPIIQSLRRVLVAFSLYSPNIGYCQSLNYIAGLLLLFMEEEKAFWTLVTIIHEYQPENMYDVTMEGSNVDQVILMQFIKEKMHSIWGKLSSGFNGGDLEAMDGNLPTLTLVTSHWFLTLYINILPIETMLRVWDCFFYEGHEVLFRVALAIFKMNENQINSVQDPMEIFQVVQNMPKRILDCHKLMELCFRRRKPLTDISNKEIERRRNNIRQRRRGRVKSMLIKS